MREQLALLDVDESSKRNINWCPIIGSIKITKDHQSPAHCTWRYPKIDEPFVRTSRSICCFIGFKIYPCDQTHCSEALSGARDESRVFSSQLRDCLNNAASKFKFEKSLDGLEIFISFRAISVNYFIIGKNNPDWLQWSGLRSQYDEDTGLTCLSDTVEMYMIFRADEV